MIEKLLTRICFFDILNLRGEIMTKIETLKNSVEVLFGSDNPMINGEEYLELLETAKSRAEREFYTQIYNFLLAQRQKEVIANESY